MRRLLRWYGANPLHLLALIGCFALAGYAAARLVPSRPLAVGAWFLGAVVGHDLLLVPLYTLADRSVMAALRHRAPRLPAITWINYLRVPAGLSLLLLLVWFPLILRLHTRYHASTTLSPNPYLWHWLAVTGVLFVLSATAFALRLRATRRPATPSAGEPVPPATGDKRGDTRCEPAGSPGAGTDDPKPLRHDHRASPGQHEPTAQGKDGAPTRDPPPQSTSQSQATTPPAE
jgi:hypothetical protein